MPDWELQPGDLLPGPESDPRERDCDLWIDVFPCDCNATVIIYWRRLESGDRQIDTGVWVQHGYDSEALCFFPSQVIVKKCVGDVETTTVETAAWLDSVHRHVA